MAKKKKTQIKPIDRGFATKSVPKKFSPPLVEEEPEEYRIDAKAPEAIVMDGQASRPTLDPEERILQNLVDQFQEKVERDITRVVKAIETDRRYSETLPFLRLDQTLVDHIITRAAEEADAFDSKVVFDDMEGKSIIKLAVTYGVLRRIGFSEERVQECLRTINGIDLDEAYEWLYLHCPETEVGMYPDMAVTKSDTPPRSSSMKTQASLIPTPSKISLNASAPAFIPTSYSSSPIPSSDVAMMELETDNNDLNVQYATICGKFDEMAADISTSDSHICSTQDPYRQRSDNILFSDIEHAHRSHHHRQQSSDISDPSSPSNACISVPSQDQIIVSEPETADIFGLEDEDDIGLLNLLEDVTTDTPPSGTIVSIRNMSLPKFWSGHTPKRLLMDFVNKSDRYATVSFKPLSDSRAKRVAVCIRWQGGKSDEWIMEDVACAEVKEAEQYVSTIALHSLTYPPMAGFQTGVSVAIGGGPTFFRTLPAVFRELWDELDDKRKLKEDQVNRYVWGTLRAILEPKLSIRADDRTNVIATTMPERPTKRSRFQPNGNISDELRSGFLARQNSPSYQNMLTQRGILPIAKYRQDIIDILNRSQVLVLSGDTGCGKSTQVPSFILENQLSNGIPCKIYCTEPRRISAISLAQRVSQELGDSPHTVGTASSLVGYSIRLESSTTKNTRLTFVTNGIALRMLEGGSGENGVGTAFDEITHILIDEVHERTIESDFLLIVLKSLLEQRSDLKVILMSATLEAEKISTYFGGCPILQVPGRTFPVQINYLEDAIEYTGWTITENSPYARRSHDKFYNRKNIPEWSDELIADDEDSGPVASDKQAIKLGKRYSKSTVDALNLFDDRLIPYDLIVRLLENICSNDTQNFHSFSPAFLIFMPGMGEIRRLNDMLSEHKLFGSSEHFCIYPLHSALSSDEQSVVFDVPPPGVRKIVIATNIAETGVTIPDITCVIDCGKHREMRFDEKRQISRLVETFIAKSNAAQRRGRAGRVQEGLCFHLFTKLREETQMADHPLPEMTRLSLSDLALRIKIMKVNLGSSIEDVLSRALDPPTAINIRRAISMLVEVGALKTTSTEELITPLGRLLSTLPTDVHLGKFLLIATVFQCLDPALTIAASLNTKSPFSKPFGLESEADRAKLSFKTENSDFLTLHRAFSSWRAALTKPTVSVHQFCKTNFLSNQSMQQIEELRQQFLGYLIDSSFIKVERSYVHELNRARYGRTKPFMVPSQYDENSTNPSLVHAAIAAGLYPKILSIEVTGAMRTITNNQQVYFHPSSVNAGRRATGLGTNFLSYFTLMHSKKLYAWETGPVDDLALALLCGELEVKLVSAGAFVDRKARYRLGAKSNVALKILRMRLASILANRFRSKPLKEVETYWINVAVQVLGKVKAEKNEQMAIVIS